MNRAAADTLTVCSSGCDYALVQDAVTNAIAGDSISVGAEVFSEQVIVDRNITIIGAGSDVSVLDGGASGTVLTVTAGVEVSLSDIQVFNGSSSTDGGGIFNEGTLNLVRVKVKDNFAENGGGGIYNTGTLTLNQAEVSGNIARSQGSNGGGGICSLGPTSVVTIIHSLITENTAQKPGDFTRGGGGINFKSGEFLIRDSVISLNNSGYQGGGILVYQATKFTLLRSTVEGNFNGTDGRAASGGGLYINGGLMNEIIDSTFTGNHTASTGGGIAALANLNITNSTISGNSSDAASAGIIARNGVFLKSVTIANNSGLYSGGIGSSGGGYFNLDNTVIADNYLVESEPPVDGSPDCWGRIQVNAGQVAFVEQLTDKCEVLGVDGTVITGEDPLLGPLADNGGSTKTHLPAVSSPVVDTGNTDLQFDQRGNARPSGAADDIGAVEVFFNVGRIFFDSFEGGL